MKDSTFRLTSGRTLQVLEGGDPTGFPVVVLHGNPGSRLLYEKHVADATQRGIRLIGYDRPGYGGSTPAPGRRVADTAADVAAIADHLGIERFGVWGHSAGGVPALACAALLPDRVVAAASLATHAPYPAEGLDWTSGMGEFNVADFRLMLADRRAWESKLATDRAELLAATPDGLRSVFATLLSEVDRRAMTAETSEYLSREVREGLRPGPEGTRDDSLWQIQPWGFDLGRITVPTQIWHGRHDRFVSIDHSRWLAARVPSAEVHLEPDEGHVTLFERRIPEVHRWILSKR